MHPSDLQEAGAPAPHAHLLQHLAELPTLSMAELTERWQLLMGTPVPHYNKRYLLRRLAYRVQELVNGGLSAATRATLATIAQQCPPPARRPAAARTRLPVVGTQLLRRWRGQVYRVEVSPTGFVYAGRRYPSLTVFPDHLDVEINVDAVPTVLQAAWLPGD